MMPSNCDGDNHHSFRKSVRRLVPVVSLRLLLAVLLFVGAYLSAGAVTRERGSKAVASFLNVAHGDGNPGYVAPFVLEHWTMTTNDLRTVNVQMDYYFWFFGWVLKAPISRTKADAMGPNRGLGDVVRESSISTFPNVFEH